MEKYTRALADALDKGAIAALEAQKTQVLKDKLNYDFSGNVIKVKKEMATEILGDIDPIMRANCYPYRLQRRNRKFGSQVGAAWSDKQRKQTVGIRRKEIPLHKQRDKRSKPKWNILCC